MLEHGWSIDLTCLGGTLDHANSLMARHREEELEQQYRETKLSVQ